MFWNSKNVYFSAIVFKLIHFTGLLKQDAVFIGSDCIDSYFDALSAFWVLYECSLTADLYLTDCLKIWARMMKIDCSRKTWTSLTDGPTLALIELLLEPKRGYLDLSPGGTGSTGRNTDPQKIPESSKTADFALWIFMIRFFFL